MSSKAETTAKNEGATPALLPKMRFPEFREAEGWKSGKVDDLVDTVTPPKKLPTAAYASSGAFPVIDQSQSDICGWTDDNEALIHEDLPLIVFGDHTCILKLIARPFAQGADGIKILKTRPRVATTFLFQFLNYRPVVTEEYKRHYSILKEKIVFFPEFKSGEQQKIAECLSSVGELMAAQARKLDALRTHKKGLMRQLFPRGGETQPRLRFPEFKSEWNDASLGDLCFTVSSGKDARDSDGAFDLYGSTGVIGKTAEASYDTPHILVARVGANAGHLTKASGQFGVTDNTLVISLKPAAGIDYIFHYLGNININKLIFGSGQPLITGSILKAQRVLVPSASEQSKISNCLSSLDDLIKAESDKLETFNTHKKGLMQQLFPSPEAIEA
jgi:type I restriction enzyme, S subunit